MSLIQLLRSIRLPRLVQPVKASRPVRISTRPKPSPSLRLTLMLANQLFMHALQKNVRSLDR
ncbi:hypothetical protein D3C71_1906340 [compost metagenome]